MILKHLELENIRPFRKFLCDFSDKINLIYGNNGIGKTTILEAVHILSLSRSFRPGMRGNIVRKGQEGCSIQAAVTDDTGKDRKFAFFKHRDDRRIKIDGTQIKGLNDLMGQLPIVVMSPDDEDVISGAAQLRRNYINRLFSVIDAEYLELLRSYERIRKQRNALLQSNQFEQAALWSDPLADKGSQLWTKRIAHIDGLIQKFEATWNSVFSELDGQIRYKTPRAVDKPGFLEALHTYAEVEMRRKTTQFGPHRDDLEFVLEGKGLKQFGSQGEKKIFLAALKKTEAVFIQEHLGKRPLVLLDDLFAKLDNRRSLKIIDLFKNEFQTLITTTDQSVRGLFEKTGDAIQMILLNEKELCSDS